MMYCERCNIDFSEGLRYCKWCGQTLIERRRATSELTACPTCNVAVQPSWAFCKACGAHLTEPAREHAAPPTIQNEVARTVASKIVDVSAIQNCSTCGEQVDQGSVYCKGCGAALYEAQTPFGSSALLCSVCNSYSPVGSTACRVCGALLIETTTTVNDVSSETVVIDRHQSSTLPDLAEHLPDDMPASTAERASHFGDDEIESGAHTIALIPEAERPGDKSLRTKGGETSMLPGVAGSKFEQPLPTSALHMERTTGPVDEEQPDEAQSPAASDERDQPRTAPVTRIDTAGFASHEGDTASDSTVQFISAADLNSAQNANAPQNVNAPQNLNSRQNEQGTIAFSSGAAPPNAFRKEDQTTAINRSEPSESREQIRTDKFAPPPSPSPVEPHHAGSNDLRAIEAIPSRAGAFSQTLAEPVRPPEMNPHIAQAQSQTAVAEPAPAVKKNNAMMIAAIASLIVFAVAAFAVWWFLIGGKPAKPSSTTVAEVPNPPAPNRPAQPPTPADKPATPAPPEGMALVPAGSYTIGRNDESDLEKPERKVDLPAYFIDRTEVTNADYKKFVDATSHKPPANWEGGYPSELANYPVTSITWKDAADYAQWAGKRLPTESEWEAAARGSEGRRYPWGNDWRAGTANIGVKSSDKSSDNKYPSQIKPAGQYPDGASASGALDMIGNVWEFTADEFNLYPGNPQSLEAIKTNLKLTIEPGKTYRIIRGGAFDGDKRHDASYRGLVDASLPYPKTGFRCAKDAK
jgi:formylglycine-generating enzyme required for sulfatase activity